MVNSCKRKTQNATVRWPVLVEPALKSKLISKERKRKKETISIFRVLNSNIWCIFWFRSDYQNASPSSFVFVSIVFDDFSDAFVYVRGCSRPNVCLRYKSACFHVWSKPSNLFFHVFSATAAKVIRHGLILSTSMCNLQPIWVYEWHLFASTSTSSRNVHM